MSEHVWKCPEMAGNKLNWLRMAGNGWKCIHMTGKAKNAGNG